MIDVSVLKKGDQYYNQEDGWIVVDRVEPYDGTFKIWSIDDQYLRVGRDGTDISGDTEWSITQVKIADENRHSHAHSHAKQALMRKVGGQVDSAQGHTTQDKGVD